MANYSYKFKKKIVTTYLNGEGGYLSLAKEYGIPDMDKVRLWGKNYQVFGDDGLVSSRKQENILLKRSFLL